MIARGSFGIAGGVVGLSGAIVSTWATVPIGFGFGYLLAEKVFTKTGALSVMGSYKLSPVNDNT